MVEEEEVAEVAVTDVVVVCVVVTPLCVVSVSVVRVAVLVFDVAVAVLDETVKVVVGRQELNPDGQVPATVSTCGTHSSWPFWHCPVVPKAQPAQLSRSTVSVDVVLTVVVITVAVVSVGATPRQLSVPSGHTRSSGSEYFTQISIKKWKHGPLLP